MKLVFCGTPAFAVPTLKLALRAGYDVPLVVTQPDRPVGRGQVITAPPVKTAALEAGIRILQPEKIKNNLELRAELEATRRDNDGLRRSSARLRAENARLVLQFKRRSAAPDRRSAMRDALLDRCSLNP